MRAGLKPAALLLVCLLAAGCGGGNGKRRAAISKYFDQVNVVQSHLAQPLLEVSKANRAFAIGKSDLAKTRARLARSELTFERLRKQLAAVKAPPDGRPLQRLLLELVTREAELAHETAQLAHFLPAFAAALKPVAPAGRRLKAQLKAKQPAPAKATALELYRDQLGSVLVQLRALQPPPSSRPTFNSQLQTLGAVRSAVTALARALRAKRNNLIGPLLRRFDLAATGNQTLAAQHAQIDAIRAYNGRVRELDRIAQKIARERARLAKLLR